MRILASQISGLCNLVLFPWALKDVFLRKYVSQRAWTSWCVLGERGVLCAFRNVRGLTEKKQMPTVLLFSLIGCEPLRPLQPFHSYTESQVHTLIEHLSSKQVYFKTLKCLHA